MKLLLAATIAAIFVASFGIANATSLTFDRCYTSQNHHCMEYLPGQNHNITGAPQNWSFTIIDPDGTCNITGHLDNQGNCNVQSKILSDKNFTALKSSPFIGTVKDIFSTSSGPLTNYCPIALANLVHQDGYFDKIKNVTNLIYPDYCTKETGPNPFPVPEFAQVVTIVAAIGVLSAIVFTSRKEFIK